MEKYHIVKMIQHYFDGNTKEFMTVLAIVGIMWLFVGISMSLDLISGWRKAKERNEARTSYGLRRTVTKFVMYYAMMLFALMFDCIGMFFYPLPCVTFIAAAFLMFIEAKSIFEKAHDKDKRKLNNSLKDLSIMLENKEDIIKGLAELLKKIAEEKEVKDEIQVGDKKSE